MPETEHFFTREDREALTVLGVDMQYMKQMLAEIRDAISDKGSFHRRLSAVEADVGMLKQFRWWILGVAAGAGALVHLAVDVFVPRH